MTRVWIGAALVLVGLLVAPSHANHGNDWPNHGGGHGDESDSRGSTPWPNHGGGLENRRDAPLEREISKHSVTHLSLKWTAHTGLDVTATPAIGGGAVYFPCWDGSVYAVNQHTGALIWKKNLSNVTAGIPAIANAVTSTQYLGGSIPPYGVLISRSTPTVAGDLIVYSVYGPSVLLAFCRSTGDLAWASPFLSSHPYSLITQSATYYQGAIYVGTSSLEEAAPAETCCYFQGAFFKLKASTGKVIWRTPMLPDNHGKPGLYSGVAIWGSSPAIDVRRRLVFVATGNTYSVPPDVEDCELARQNLTNPPIPDPCLSADNHGESIVAMNIDTGSISWSRHLGGYDTWTAICQFSAIPPENCPKILGPDFDFGEAPFLVSIKNGKKWRDIVVAGQKSGFVHALDRVTGDIVWQADAGPGGFGGGASWGMTTDGTRVFTNIINNQRKNFTLVPTSKVVTWGGWVAMNASTGAVIWTTANPYENVTLAPLTHANGVVFGASQGGSLPSQPGAIIALDAATGSVLWTYETNGGLDGGLSISNGCIFKGVGRTLSTLLGVSDYHGNSTIAMCVASHWK